MNRRSFFKLASGAVAAVAALAPIKLPAKQKPNPPKQHPEVDYWSAVTGETWRLRHVYDSEVIYSEDGLDVSRAILRQPEIEAIHTYCLPWRQHQPKFSDVYYDVGAIGMPNLMVSSLQQFAAGRPFCAKLVFSSAEQVGPLPEFTEEWRILFENPLSTTTMGIVPDMQAVPG